MYRQQAMTSYARSPALTSSRKDVALVQTNSTPKTQPYIKGKSWRAPIVMLSSIVSATLLAVLHDGINRSLNGNIVIQDGPWNQQWTSRYGTTLAFLIKMLFVTCVGTAFVQRQWLNLSTRQKAIRVQNLDVLSSALSTPVSLFSASVWLRNPLLLLIVAISWTIPFAAIITPGTLSVDSKPYTYSANRTAIQLNSEPGNSLIYQFGLNETSKTNASNQLTTWYIEGYKSLSTLALAVATSSQIRPMISDFANQTYSTTFFGPALNCTDANSTITTVAADFALGIDLIGTYMAWVGDPAPWLIDRDPSPEGLQNFTFATSTPSICDPSLKSQTEINNSIWILYTLRTDSEDLKSEVSLKECQLWNATYETEIAYHNFEQTITIHNLTYQNQVASYAGPDERMCTSSGDSSVLYKTIASAFASSVVGVGVGVQDLGLLFTQASSLDLFNIVMNDTAKFGQGIEEVFMNITLSLFSSPEFVTNTTDTISADITSWMNTYVYQRRDLLLAYGMAFLASLICCILGMHSFYRNGGSFQNNFSTYIRAVRGSDFDVEVFVLPGDNGADPLPERMGKQMITMASMQTR